MPDVVYEMSLKDGLTNKLHQADGAATKLDATMGSLGRRLTHVAEAFGVSFALFRGIEFIHGATEEYEKFEFSQSQVIAGLKSTEYAAGVTADQLEESALKMAHSFKFTKSEITGMQSIVLTFPGITKNTFDTASQAILDMSTRLHKGLDETALMVGKALQDPKKGIKALRLVGVNFNDTQTEIIRKLVETGQAAKAQTLILKELQTEFAGSAKEAAKADVLFRYNKAVEELKLGIGEAADKMLEYFTPALEGVINVTKKAFEFIKEHKDLLKSLAVGVGVAAISYGVYRTILLGGVAIQALSTAWTYIQIAAMYSLGTAYEGVGIATKLLAAAQYALNAAWEANPVGIVILALAAVGAAIYAAYEKVSWFRAGLWGLWYVVKEVGTIIKDFFVTVWDIVTHPLSLGRVKDDFAKLEYIASSAGMRIAIAAKEGYSAGLKDFTSDNHTNSPKDANKKYSIKPGAVNEVKPETKGAKGNKVVTINIKIDSLIKDFKINTTNIKEGTAKVQEMVTQVMMNAVNNSQIIASS